MGDVYCQFNGVGGTFKENIYSQLARGSTARGSLVSPGGLTKVRACKSVLFSESSPVVKIKIEIPGNEMS